MSYLYHYTSIESLALILNNKTIRFNNLLNVDDMEEAQTSDMGNFGKYVYVSCWTDDSKELIPLWNMYTPNMHGVRIRLKKFPFKKHYYKAGELFFKEDVISYIDYSSDLINEKCSITPNSPLLVKVEYTNDQNCLFPVVKSESYFGAAMDYIQTKSLKELKEPQVKISYSFEKLGNYKREDWAFQKEWRYKIITLPMGIIESNPPSFEKQKEYIKRLEDKLRKPPVQSIYLNLDENTLSDLEVVFGPKMTEAEKMITIALLDKYAPFSIYRESNLRIN